jgi:GNAT superfamily N-acetyltransferase
MKVTPLLFEQLPFLFPIGHAFTDEVGRADFNEGAFLGSWSPLMESGVGEIHAIWSSGPVTRDQKIIAVLGAAFSPDMFSGRMTATELFWYVLPEFRKTGAGLMLLDHFEERAEARGCSEILMVHFAHMGASLQKLYESRGFSLLEQTFRKES